MAETIKPGTVCFIKPGFKRHPEWVGRFVTTWDWPTHRWAVDSGRRQVVGEYLVQIRAEWLPKIPSGHLATAWTIEPEFLEPVSTGIPVSRS